MKILMITVILTMGLAHSAEAETGFRVVCGRDHNELNGASFGERCEQMAIPQFGSLSKGYFCGLDGSGVLRYVTYKIVSITSPAVHAGQVCVSVTGESVKR